MSEYKKRKDGEGFTIPSGERYRIACCDCGLVHDFVFVSEDGKDIGIAAKRNNSETRVQREMHSLLENDIRTLQKAIHRVRAEAIHGLYGEAPETTRFENALYDLYGLVPWEVGEALQSSD